MKTKQQAISEGFTIDNHANPPVAYKGPRFSPSEIHEIAEIDLNVLYVMRNLRPYEIRERGNPVEKVNLTALTEWCREKGKKFDDAMPIGHILGWVFTN